MSAIEGFQAPVRAWFEASFHAPTRPQELGWPPIASGGHTLILAPTGSGKTLAAFLVAIDRLMFAPVPEKTKRCRVLYVSPLKALAVDVERNLRAPLVGITRYAERMGVTNHEPTVAIRTGDTPSQERAKQVRNPADILITTPESLYLLLTSQARDTLRSVNTVIIDEIHAMVNTKRGAHLTLSLERLQELTGGFQRIGLSATQRPLDEVARFLGGFEAQWDRGTVGQGDTPEETVADALPTMLGDAAEYSVPLSPCPTVPLSSSLTPRPVAIIDAGSRKELELTVEVPVEDMARISKPVEIPSGNAAQGETRYSIWPAMHPMILDLIRQHRSTLIFVNSRRLAERMAAALNELAGEEIVRAHHGSIAREQRLQIEDELKSGRLPAMVATSSLELGIDMGAIDLVIQVEAPPSVASGLQRVGRAGHHIGVPSRGVIIPKFRGDLLACATLTERMKLGAVEEMRYPRNPLDVLAQQIVAMVGMDEWSVGELERVIRRAAPFAELPRTMLYETLDMLSGRYPSDDFAELRPRITWDRLNGLLHSREGAKRIAITNGGTIPDRGLYGVFLAGAEKGRGRVGELDEEMVLESHAGEVFLLGASSWRIEEITHDRVVVSPAPGEPGKMPFWHGERAGRPLEFGRAIGRLTRTLRELPQREAVELLVKDHSLTEKAAVNLLQYLSDQVEAVGALPDDRTIVIESSMDELGDWRMAILSPFGSKVHAPWAMAIGAMLREQTEAAVDVLWTDDGIVVRLPESDEPPPAETVIPDPDEVEDLVIRQLSIGGGGVRETGNATAVNALFASHFRESAARALLLPRKHPGQRAPLWQQRKRAAELLSVTSRYGSFPIILETFRECLKDVFDMPALTELLREIRSRDIRVVPVTTRAPSPFAASLMYSYVAQFMYEGDSPLAERRAQALTVDPAQLRELLGEVELRELLDADVLEVLELYLQHLTPERAAKHADGLHDLLLRLGDLSEAEIAARTPLPPEGGGCGAQNASDCGPASTSTDSISKPSSESGQAADAHTVFSPFRGQGGIWLNQLQQQRRTVTLPIAGETRYIAAEDAGRYRDALGIPPPPGLPDAFLEYVRDPLGDLIARYARTHGPFRTEEVAARFGLGTAPVLNVLQRMAQAGRLLEGEFRPGGAGREWCDPGVLRALRQKSLARLRHEVEPVDPPALGRLYAAWQGIRSVTGGQGDRGRRRGESLLRVIEQLQGAAIPASVLETQVLPARIPDYSPASLDQLMASGEVIWVGRESLGQHDGRVSLYLTEHAPLLLSGLQAFGRSGDEVSERLNARTPERPLADAIRSHLATRGASFFPQIVAACGGFAAEVQQALWDLVWTGEVTNDTLQPLRAFLNPRRAGRDGPRPRRTESPRRRMAIIGSHQAARPNLYAPTRSVHPDTAGRWSLVSSLVYGLPTPTERLNATAQQLLDRYGILTREVAQHEGIEGGFTAIYGVLKALEEAGRVRRGYFVSGLGAAQFAVPGAVDRLRAMREPPEMQEAILLAATDPANPYGAALTWPNPSSESAAPSEHESADSPFSGRGGRRPMRQAGAIVILVDGALAGWMGRGERHLLTFLDQVPDRDPQEVAFDVARALAAEVRPAGRRAMFVTEVDGQPAEETPMAAALIEAGFQRTSHGFLKRL